MHRKTCLLLLLVCFLVSIVAFPVSASPTEGTYGDNIKWHFDTATGTLTISGTGTVPKISESSTDAYMPYRIDARHLVIEDGITKVGAYSFCGTRRWNNARCCDASNSV